MTHPAFPPSAAPPTRPHHLLKGTPMASDTTVAALGALAEACRYVELGEADA